jgi:hypothetical protein
VPAASAGSGTRRTVRCPHRDREQRSRNSPPQRGNDAPFDVIPVPHALRSRSRLPAAGRHVSGGVLIVGSVTASARGSAPLRARAALGLRWVDVDLDTHAPCCAAAGRCHRTAMHRSTQDVSRVCTSTEVWTVQDERGPGNTRWHGRGRCRSGQDGLVSSSRRSRNSELAGSGAAPTP